MTDIKHLCTSFFEKIFINREDQYIIELKKLVEEYHLNVKWVEWFENKYSLWDLVYVTWKSQYSIQSTYEAIKDIEILNYRYNKILLRNKNNISKVRA